MKAVTFIILWCSVSTLVAQTTINKTVPVHGGQKIRMRFDYPNLVKVSTWEKNEISIQGTVSINGGESDDAFKLETSTEGNTVSIRNEIKNMENLPHRITVTMDGRKTVFRNKSEWHKYQDENGKTHTTISEGLDMEINLEIKVPRNTETYVESVYGMVEIVDFTGPLTVEATYGGIDASLTEPVTGELVAETNYGRIYTNVDIKVTTDNVRDEDFHTYVSVKGGNGPRNSFESKYGNVYLRKRK